MKCEKFLEKNIKYQFRFVFIDKNIKYRILSINYKEKYRIQKNHKIKHALL